MHQTAKYTLFCLDIIEVSKMQIQSVLVKGGDEKSVLVRIKKKIGII